MARRLIVLFDGTWSAAHARTNVERFRQLIAPADARGTLQLCKYIVGVGVKPGIGHWLGGAFGLGLADNVKDGFQWLSENWCAGDEIWLLGFSRGAYTARSVAGLIRKCGLLWPSFDGRVSAAGVDRAYALYRNALHPDHRKLRRFRSRHSRAAGIRFIGVWETVGMLGIPGVAAWFPFARARYAFHDTELSRIVQYAYQALALDEHRFAFRPTKWTPPASNRGVCTWKPQQIEVEQRWFVGSHADVGGGDATDGVGHHPDPLPEIPLAWMQAKARRAGLAFLAEYLPGADAELGVPNPSYRRFLLGLYQYFSKRYDRVLGGGVNETIDPSVWRKRSLQPAYESPSIGVALRAGRIHEGGVEVA